MSVACSKDFTLICDNPFPRCHFPDDTLGLLRPRSSDGDWFLTTQTSVPGDPTTMYCQWNGPSSGGYPGVVDSKHLWCDGGMVDPSCPIDPNYGVGIRWSWKYQHDIYWGIIEPNYDIGGGWCVPGPYLVPFSWQAWAWNSDYCNCQPTPIGHYNSIHWTGSIVDACGYLTIQMVRADVTITLEVPPP